MTAIAADRNTWIATYRGSIEHLRGQAVKVIGFDPSTGRYTLELITGAILENVRRKSFIG